jgi:hypothetical protein
MAAIKRYSVAKTQDSCSSPSTTLGSTVYSETEAWKAGTYDGGLAKGNTQLAPTSSVIREGLRLLLFFNPY